MPCLMGCLALSFPRVALFLVWLFGGSYLERAYDSILLPLLGFVFLPLTTLAFAYSWHSLREGGHVSSIGWLLTIVALLIDIGLIGGGSQSARRWQKRH